MYKYLTYACMFAAFSAPMVVETAFAAKEESFPVHPVRWVVGTQPGGGTDIVVRLVARKMEDFLGQPLVVENKPGGGTTIAANSVSNASPDGYTILASDPGTIIFSTALYSNLSYDPAKDFTSVGLLARVPLVLAVSASSPYSDVRDLLEDMRKTPEKFPVSTAGIGSPHHIALEFLKDQAKLDVEHVSYKGSAPAIQDVLAGVVPVTVVDLGSAMAQLKAGTLKALATFNAEPLASMPNVPSLVQLGLTSRVPPSYLSVVAPHATPPQSIKKLSSSLRQALSDPEIQARLKEMGAEPLPSSSEQMTKQWHDDLKIWPAMIRERGIKLN